MIQADIADFPDSSTLTVELMVIIMTLLGIFIALFWLLSWFWSIFGSQVDEEDVVSDDLPIDDIMEMG